MITLVAQSDHMMVNRVRSALDSVGAHQGLARIFNLFLTSTSPEVHESHAIILMRRQLTLTPEAGDNAVLEFRSSRIAQDVWNALWCLEYVNSLQLVTLFSTHAALSVPRGWAFENLAHRHLTFLTPTEVYFPPPYKSSRTPLTSNMFPKTPRLAVSCPSGDVKSCFTTQSQKLSATSKTIIYRGAPTTHYLTLCSLDRISPPRKTSIFLYPPTSICTFSRCQSPRFMEALRRVSTLSHKYSRRILAWSRSTY